jgi:hypothetical protein
MRDERKQFELILNMMSKTLTLNALTGLKLTSSIRGVNLARADPVAQQAFKRTEYDTSLWVLSGCIPFFRPQALLQRGPLPFTCGTEHLLEIIQL